MKKLSAMLAAALIALTLSVPVLAEPSESSTEESTAQQSAEQSNEQTTEETSQSDTEEVSEASGEASAEESADSSAQESQSSGEQSGEASKTTETSKTEESSGVVEIPSLEEYRVDEAHMNISFPNNMYVITRDTEANDPAFEAYRLTKNEIMEKFQESATYIRASAKDFSYDITVTVMENADTQAVKELSSLSDKEIDSVIGNLLKQKVYKGCTRTELNNTLFLTLNMEEDTDTTKILGIQEYTIVNGVRVIVTFQTYDGVIDESEQQMFDEVMDSVRFDGVEAAPVVTPSGSSAQEALSVDSLDIRYIYLIIAATIGLIALVVMITAGMRYKRSKRLIDEQEEEEIEIDAPKRSTTRLVENEETEPREPEDIFSDTKIEKYGTQEFSLDAAMLNTAPMTYESLTAGSPVQEKLAEDTVSVTEMPADAAEEVVSSQPEGYTEIEAMPEETEVQQPLTDGFETADRSTEALPENESEEAPENEEVVFAEITEKRHTEIEQIGISEQEQEPAENEQPAQETTEPPQEQEEEPSAYEKRFGKSRVTPPVTAAAAASPDIMLVNTDEKRASKFEKHFGKLEPAAPEAAAEVPAVTETPAAAASVVTETPAVEAPAVTEQTQTENEQSTEQAFSKLIDRLRTGSAEAAPAPVMPGEQQTSGTLIYQGKPAEPEKPAESQKSEADNDTIELEISKSPDGSLIIGAMNEGSGKPLDVEIRDSADLRAERKREWESMGLESANKNEIYNHRDAMVKEGFTVKAKESDGQPEEEETGSRFDKLFGPDREKKPVETKKPVQEDADEPDFEESAFEKRFGKGKVNASAAGAADTSATAMGTGVAVTAAGAVTAASAGTAAVAAVFGKAEQSKGKKKHAAEPTKPETVEEFFEGVKEETPAAPAEPTPAAPAAETPSAQTEPSAETPSAQTEPSADTQPAAGTGSAGEEQKSAVEQHKSRRDVFMFERDSGIIFEHARESRQPIQPMYSSFTKVPRLEDVNADEYNKQYDEMRKSMPRNRAYAQRFGNAAAEQPAPAEPEKTAPAQPAAPVNPRPEKKAGAGKANAPKDDSVIEFYTGYEEDDPFGGSGSPDQEVIIKDANKKKSGSVGSRFKRSFGKFFSNESPEDED